jgi:hypothetical protein
MAGALALMLIALLVSACDTPVTVLTRNTTDVAIEMWYQRNQRKELVPAGIKLQPGEENTTEMMTSPNPDHLHLRVEGRNEAGATLFCRVYTVADGRHEGKWSDPDSHPSLDIIVVDGQDFC